MRQSDVIGAFMKWEEAGSEESNLFSHIALFFPVFTSCFFRSGSLSVKKTLYFHTRSKIVPFYSLPAVYQQLTHSFPVGYLFFDFHYIGHFWCVF